MRIAYISADFDVPIRGSEGASIHLREMAAAFCREGHAVWVVSPVMETMAVEKRTNGGEGEMARRHEEFFASPAPRRAGTPLANDLDGVMFVPVPPHKHHEQIFKELESLDKFWGMKTRHTQELRHLLYNLTLYEKALNYLRSCRVDFIYERYSLFSHAGIRLAKALGVPHYEEVPRYIAAMDVAVAPYKSENFYHSPLPIFEYMAMGKPIVASGIGQVQEVIANGETGVLYASGNFAQLTAALAKLAGNVPLCRRLGEKARAWVQKERMWENNVRHLVKIADELIAKRNHAAN